MRRLAGHSWRHNVLLSYRVEVDLNSLLIIPAVSRTHTHTHSSCPLHWPMAGQLSVWSAAVQSRWLFEFCCSWLFLSLVSSSLLMYIVLCFPHCDWTRVFSSRKLLSSFRFAVLSCSFQSRCVSFSCTHAPSVYLYAFLNHAFISRCKWWAPAKDFLTCVFYVSFICTVWHSWFCHRVIL